MRDATPSPTRPWVDAFSDEMEARLAANRHKGDRNAWMAEQSGYLMAKLIAEVAELQDALNAVAARRCGCREAGCPHIGIQDDARAQVRSEAADLANFAMMIADVVGGLDA